MGSGLLIRRAIKKHGKEHFTKEILFVFDNEQAMNDKEAELVVVSEDTYNLCSGGQGGFSFINSNGLNSNTTDEHKAAFVRRTREKPPTKGVKLSDSHKKKLSQSHRGLKTFLGKQHSEESKRKIGDANRKITGDKNGSYGTCWITDGVNNKKHSINSAIPDGWYRGRKL